MSFCLASDGYQELIVISVMLLILVAPRLRRNIKFW